MFVRTPRAKRWRSLSVGGNVSVKLQELSVAIGRNEDIANKLDAILTGPNDRAFVICEFDDCKFNVKGRCNIYAVQDVPRMKTKGPCERYEPRPAQDVGE